jgi:orotidine-5'-phosphate decarboxylase
VGAQGGSAQLALQAGADYLIVGRSVYEAENPAACAERLISEIRQS